MSVAQLGSQLREVIPHKRPSDSDDLSTSPGEHVKR
jgi:hypothetical protein